MPNSIKRFEVVSTNNKSEDQWFIVTVIAIVALAASLLYWQHHDKYQTIKIIPKEISAVINQLTSTGDEVNFLINAELLPAQPSLLQLQQASVVPFDSRHFSSPIANCFITKVTASADRNVPTEYQIALWLDKSGHQLAWRTQDTNHSGHSDQHTQNNVAENSADLCEKSQQHWQFIEANVAHDTAHHS